MVAKAVIKVIKRVDNGQVKLNNSVLGATDIINGLQGRE